MSGVTALVSAGLIVAAVTAAREAEVAPFAWAYYSCAVWSVWLVSKGWNALNSWEKLHFFWAAASVVALCKFTRATLSTDDPFEGWGDIYYFCGQDYRYCNCDFTWNLAGWGKALVLWNFVVTASLGVQKLVIYSGLNGLLPGEEVVTKESLVSFCWRLIPYWLNSWEQQWGAECSSVMFELPHFALELLVVLPCVQIMASRLKILLMPPGRGLVPPFDQATPPDASSMAPVIMAGVWEERKADHDLKGRIRANFRVLTLLVGISALAACNALYVPLRLEQVIHTHPRSIALLHAAEADGWLREYSNVTASEDTYTSAELVSMVAHFDAKGCVDQNKLASNLVKHASEISKMQKPIYQELTMCVEAALTIMRLSCEQYFTLISIFAAYLLFRQHPPLWARQIIWINHRVSTMFKKTILYSFPAVCWLYGAGFMFSSFASLVFWGQPVARLWELLRAQLTVVQPVGLQEATEAQIEQMNGNCAVCWAPMTPTGRIPSPPSDSNPSSSSDDRDQGNSAAGPEQQPQPQQQPQGFMEVPYFPFHHTHGQDPLAPDTVEQVEEEEDTATDSCKALPCGHAFHTGCIAKWLQRCHAQSRQVTCPMCNLVIKLEVSFRLNRIWSCHPVAAASTSQPAAATATGAGSQQPAEPQHQPAEGDLLQEQAGPHDLPAHAPADVQSGSPASSDLPDLESCRRLRAKAENLRQRISVQLGEIEAHRRGHHVQQQAHSPPPQQEKTQQQQHQQQQSQQQQSQQQQQQQQRHQQQRQQQQWQDAVPEQWQPGLSTYQALERLHSSAQPPSFLRPSPPLFHRQNSDPLLHSTDQGTSFDLSVPSQSPAWSSSSLITGRHVHQPLSPQTQYVSQTFGVARVSPTAQSMHQGDMTLSERRSVGSQPAGTRAKQGLLARLLRTRSRNSDISRSRTPSRQ